EARAEDICGVICTVILFTPQLLANLYPGKKLKFMSFCGRQAEESRQKQTLWHDLGEIICFAQNDKLFRCGIGSACGQQQLYGFLYKTAFSRSCEEIKRMLL
ncbi:MAG: hypothetical protein ACSW75_01815, partial [Lachnospiraceae bacterium]